MYFSYNQFVSLLYIEAIIANSKYIISRKKMICFGCKTKQQNLQNSSSVQKNEEMQYIVDSNQNTSQSKSRSKQLENEKQQQENSIYFSCSCCQNLFCLDCCRLHNQKTSQKENQENVENEKRSQTQIQMNNQQLNTQESHKKIQIICQECEDMNSVKYCQNCGQYLCEKCSFKIHNKGKRAKHTLQENIERNINVHHIVLLTKDWTKQFQESSEESLKFQDNFGVFVKDKLKMNREQTLFLVEKGYEKQKEKLTSKKYFIDFFESDGFKLQEILTMKNKYPFFDFCKIVIFSSQVIFHQNIIQEYQKKQMKNFKIEVQQEKKKQNQLKHERIFSQKVSITHNKNISNFSNLSAISKVENQSIISNQQSDIFQNNQSSSLNVTLNQNSSILMMGDYEKEEKQEKKVELKQQKQIDKPVLNRIYSIREENSNNEANNMSVSTQNSLRKRNRKWPIPYFQPMRIPKYEKGPKYDAQIYLRELAQKGILMIRREKAEHYLLDPEISRTFVRNIGERQIEYVAYIIDFLSVQCLTWVIESVKEDKMTPNQKLIQSRLKESFDLKVNMKLWQSIIKYLQSSQYQQDYMQNTKIRYVPKISIVKYQDQYLLEFEERKWAYQDQQLLDQQEEEWTQFKQLITDYFNGKNQITGGRYGCVQYVKLNGPKPLRKCSLGKISMFVQEAINKGIIRYHKTLLVSNSENNNSFFSQQANSLDEGSKLFQLQKELKVLAIQLALIDMFLEVPPNTQISLAQIPLNLKKSIIFDYTLVQLGFPKLKNILNTLADKLILQTTKTHISYEITTNGVQTIQKIRKQAVQQNQYFLSHIVNQIGTIVHHYQSLTLEDLYNQLNSRLGFTFQYKLYQLPDFYQFVLYYCANVVTVQFVAGMFVVTSKYQQTYPVYQQTHRATYSQQTYPNYVNYYQNPIEASSKTTQKKTNSTKPTPQLDEMLEQPQLKDTIATPKFNSNTFIQSKKWSFGWSQYLGQDKREQKFQDQQDQDENHSRQMEHIINILDDGDKSATRPKTVIVNEGLQQQQFYILPKLNQPGDQIDSFGAEKAQWVMADGVNKTNKGQHTRFKSTNQVPTKHFRQYSTTNTKK